MSSSSSRKSLNNTSSVMRSGNRLNYTVISFRCVFPTFVTLFRSSLFAQIPHAFQQKLSTEKTPTLCYALPFFQSVITNWEKMKVEHPELRRIINPAIAKLTTYQYRIGDVPAYALAMGVYFCIFQSFYPNLYIF